MTNTELIKTIYTIILPVLNNKAFGHDMSYVSDDFKQRIILFWKETKKLVSADAPKAIDFDLLEQVPDSNNILKSVLEQTEYVFDKNLHLTEGIALAWKSLETKYENEIKSIINKEGIKFLSNTSSSKINYKSDNNNQLNKNNTTHTRFLSNIPRGDVLSIGRDDDLKQLHEIFKTKRIINIHGVAGIGKTTLARAYINKFSQKYSNILWLDASIGFSECIINNYVLHSNLNILKFKEPNKLQYILNKLQNLGGSNLMIIDNPNREIEKILQSLPDKSWNIILTSHLQITGVHNYLLNFLSNDASKQLFYSYYKDVQNDEELILILNLFNNHTLVTEVLAKYAENKKLSINQLKQIIEENGINIKDKTSVLTEHSEDYIDNISNYLNKIFPISQLPENELTILRLIALMPSGFVPYHVLNKLKPEFSRKKTNLIAKIFYSHTKPPVFSEIIDNLASKGLLEYADNQFRLHEIVRLMILDKYPVEFDFYVPLVSKIISNLYIASGEDPTEKFQWIAFGEELLKYFKIENHDILLLANNLASVHKKSGNYQRSLYWYETALESAMMMYDSDHNEVKAQQSNLSLVYRELGQYDKSIDIQKKVLEYDIKKHGEVNIKVATSYSNLANTFFNLKRYKEAEKLFRKSLEINLKLLGEDDFSVAIDQSNLANVLSALGRIEEARDILEKVRINTIKNFGEEHHSMGTTLSNLALIYQDLGELEKARDFMEQSLVSGIKKYGEEHPNIAIRQSNLANIYKEQGFLDAAKDLQEKSLATSIKHFGENHPKTALRLSNLGNIYKSLGDLLKAKNLLEKALKIDRNYFGEGHPTVAIRQNNLASIYQSLGLIKEAKELWTKAYHTWLQRYGPNHPNTKITKDNLDGVS